VFQPAVDVLTLPFLGKGSEMPGLPGVLWKSFPLDAGCDPAVHSTRSACSSCIREQAPETSHLLSAGCFIRSAGGST
jgi:hypothetical protein